MSDQSLGENLGYYFTDSSLLNRALRHRSTGKLSNERLEFLGDAVLDFVIADELFQRYPESKEGELSRLRANLVNGEILANIAQELQIGKYIQCGAGDLKRGRIKHKSILADAVEAIIGAIYLDGGFAAAKYHVLRWFATLLDATTGIAQKDPKTLLQELLQMRKFSLPIYKVAITSGAAHARTFTVSCKVTEIDKTTTGTGPNKRSAERDAAHNMLLLLEKSDEST